ncbi:hypothetical protein Syun_015832 [Stephania yunnanensis]|uniref:PRONE domain-containing protein n=1 Tax=Stephania yunnanensis TaxID=152371 RepID=A0AAP0J5F5_9MAGN
MDQESLSLVVERKSNNEALDSNASETETPSSSTATEASRNSNSNSSSSSSSSSSSDSDTPTSSLNPKPSRSLGGGRPIHNSSNPPPAATATKPYQQQLDLQKDSSNYISDVEMMKERFCKLLLGEDMSGSGKGVCTALAISNAITNLCATLFGQLWRLQPLSPHKKSMWKTEMECLLCVAHHIVQLIPSFQTFPDGTKLEVMTCRPRSDLNINLPALCKLDNMLLEILDSFHITEFWYADQGVSDKDGDGAAPLLKPPKRQDDKWWLPVPCVPPAGLTEESRKQLHHKRECANQILKAAMAINSVALAEMEVPLSYTDALPKNGRASLGDLIYRYITSDQFSPECLLDCLDLSSEHQALEIANRIEASIYVWRRRTSSKPPTHPNRPTSKSSWGIVKEFMVDVDRRGLLADRAESLLLCLKQRFPGLPQTTLDTSKIQFNKDVGKSILESYSRVVESLAYNIVSRIDDLLYVDDLAKSSDQLSSVSMIPQKRVTIQCSVPVSSTPCATAFTTPSFSPASLVSPASAKKERTAFTAHRFSPASSLFSPASAKKEKMPFLNGNKPHHRGFGVKKVLIEYLGVDKSSGTDSLSNTQPQNAAVRLK